MRVVLSSVCFLTALLVSCSPALAGLVAGDIAFLGYNIESDDDLAFVVLTDVTSETIFFTDRDVNSSGVLQGAEGTLRWDTGAVTIASGTVITFTDFNSTGSFGFGASTGILTALGSTNLASSDDSLLAFQGASSSSPTLFLAGFEISTGAAGPVSSVGLVPGQTFLDVSGTSSNIRGAEYNGPRLDESSFADYRPLIYDRDNWERSSGAGTVVLPFDTTSFSITAVPEPSAFLFGGMVCGILCVVHRRRLRRGKGD